MATATCTLTGAAHLNGMWVPGGSAYSGIGATTHYAGGNSADAIQNMTYVERFTIPALNGSFTDSTLTFTFDIVKSNSSSTTLKWGISTVGNEGQARGTALPPMIATGSWYFGGITNQHQQFTATTTAVNFGSGGSLSGTYYLWLWGGSIVQMYQHGSFYTASINYTAITACVAPTYGSVSAAVAVPGGSVTLSWGGHASGVGNSLNGFHIQYSDDWGANWYDYATVGYVSSYSVPAPSTRGTRRYFRVRSQGTAGSGYYSGFSVALAYVTTNTLPAAPSVSVSRSIVPSAGGSVTFTASPGYDPEQTGSVYYAVGASGTKYYVNGSVALNIVSGSNAIYFWTWDGLEYSASSTLSTITINTKPNITSLGLTRTALAGSATANYPLSKAISATPTISKAVTTYNWIYATASATGNIPTSGTSFNTAATLNNFDITALITRGNFYRIGLQVNDGLDDSNILWETYGGQLPLAPLAATLVSVFNQPGLATANVAGTSANNYNTGVTLKWNNPAVASGRCNIDLVQILGRFSADAGTTYSQAQAYGSFDKTNGKANVIGDVDLTSYTRGHYTQVGVRITDTAGVSTDVWYGTTMIRAVLPELAGSVLTCNLRTIKPYTNTSVFTLTGMVGTGVNGLVYQYAASFEDRTTTIVNIPYVTGNLSIIDATSILTLPAATINNILKAAALRDSTSPDIWNYNYARVRYRISISDNFGNVGDSVYTTGEFYNVNFIEAPAFVPSARMNLTIQYCTGGPTKVVTTASTNNDRMVQAGELARFIFTLPTDWNQDVVSYDLLVSRMDNKPNRLGTSYDTYNYELLASFSTNDKVATGVANEYYLERAVVAYSVNKFLTFALRAVDSKGNYSNLLYSQTYLVACRKTSPTFSVDNLAVNQTTNLLTFSLNMSSLGGSIFEGNVPVRYGYFGMADYGTDANDKNSNYPNFERTITGYTSRAEVIIEICKDGDFSNTVATNYLKTTLVHSGAYSTLYGATKSLSLNGTVFAGQKIFIKITVSLRTGLATSSTFTTVSTTSATLTYYAAAPTMAHRMNHIGVNINTFEEDDVLVINDFSNRRYVRFTGTDADAQSFEVLIDLKTGRIDGSVISGGSWDVLDPTRVNMLMTSDSEIFYVQK